MAQFARPDADIDISSNEDGTWEPTPLFQQLDEITPDDITTEIVSGIVAATAEDFEVSLSAVRDPVPPGAPPPVNVNHFLRVRTNLDDPLTTDIVVELKEGAMVRASRAFVQSTDSYVTHIVTLTAAEANSITDYTNLSVRVEFDLRSGTNEVFCTFIELEVPDAPVPWFHLTVGNYGSVWPPP